MLRIFGYAGSINVRKVLWACQEVGMAFEREDWGGGTRPTTDPRFLSLNPMGLIPVIDDEGLVIWESNTIVRYLAASTGRHDLLPVAARDRALVERWMDFQASDFNNSWRYAFQALVRKNPRYNDLAAVEESVRLCTSMVRAIDEIIGRAGPYIAGPNFTVADIVIGLSIHRWRSIAAADAELQNVNRYYQLLAARDGFRRYGVNGGP